jgi:hypothetical protein
MVQGAGEMSDAMLTDLQIEPGTATAIVRHGQVAVRVVLRWDKKGKVTRAAVVRMLFEHADKELARRGVEGAE